MATSRRLNGEEHPTTNNQRYNFACQEALRGRSEEALTLLRQAVDHGYRDSAMWILQDPDLASLHGEPGFQELVEELERRNDEAAQVAGAR